MLKKYLGQSKYDDILNIIWCDICDYCPAYDPNLKYAGRGNSSKFTITGFLVPELGINEVFYIHDCMYFLTTLGITGYSKELSDSLMKDLMEIEGFKYISKLYYYVVKYLVKLK